MDGTPDVASSDAAEGADRRTGWDAAVPQQLLGGRKRQQPVPKAVLPPQADRITSALWDEGRYSFANPFDGYQRYPTDEFPGPGSWGYWPGVGSGHRSLPSDWLENCVTLTSAAMRGMLQGARAPVRDLASPNDHAVRLYHVLRHQFNLDADVESRGLAKVCDNPEHPDCVALRKAVEELRERVSIAEAKEATSVRGDLLRKPHSIAVLIKKAVAAVLRDTLRLREQIGEHFQAALGAIGSQAEALERRIASALSMQAKAREEVDAMRRRLLPLSSAVAQFLKQSQAVLYPLGLPSQLEPEPQQMDAWWSAVWQTASHQIASLGGPPVGRCGPDTGECDALIQGGGTVSESDTMHFRAVLGVVRKAHSVRELASMHAKADHQLEEMEEQLSLERMRSGDLSKQVGHGSELVRAAEVTAEAARREAAEAQAELAEARRRIAELEAQKGPANLPAAKPPPAELLKQLKSFIKGKGDDPQVQQLLGEMRKMAGREKRSSMDLDREALASGGNFRPGRPAASPRGLEAMLERDKERVERAKRRMDVLRTERTRRLEQIEAAHGVTSEDQDRLHVAPPLPGSDDPVQRMLMEHGGSTFVRASPRGMVAAMAALRGGQVRRTPSPGRASPADSHGSDSPRGGGASAGMVVDTGLPPSALPQSSPFQRFLPSRLRPATGGTATAPPPIRVVEAASARPAAAALPPAAREDELTSLQRGRRDPTGELLRSMQRSRQLLSRSLRMPSSAETTLRVDLGSLARGRPLTAGNANAVGAGGRAW